MNGPMEYFKCTQEDKTVIWQTLGLTEAGIKQSIGHILDWFQKQPHLAGAFLDKDILEKMLIMSKGSIENTKQQLDKFYGHRSRAPELIQNRDQVLKEGTKLFHNFGLFVTANLFEGRRVGFLTLAPYQTSIFNEDFFKKAFMGADLRFKYDYWLSDIWILDLKHGHLGLILSLNLSVFRKAAQIFQYGLKWRLQAIHVVNVPFPANIVQRVLDFFKQFLSSLIMTRIVVHDSLDTLYEHVPKEYLPKDLGGTGPCYDELIESLENVLRSPKVKESLVELSKMVSDDSKRPKNDIEEMAGSFKQLEFD